MAEPACLNQSNHVDLPTNVLRVILARARDGSYRTNHKETFTHRMEWLPLGENHWMDYVRAHISAIGGLNMALKLGMLCEFYGE